jgi:hypothetical protein
MPVHLINIEQIGFSEQLCDYQKVPYYQVWLYHQMSQLKIIQTLHCFKNEWYFYFFKFFCKSFQSLMKAENLVNLRFGEKL